jgi:hypothetical protein
MDEEDVQWWEVNQSILLGSDCDESYKSEDFGQLVREGYSQTYILLNAKQRDVPNRSVYFCGGGHCYDSMLPIDFRITRHNIPSAIAHVASKMDDLDLLADSVSEIATTSPFYKPAHHLQEVAEFIAEELPSKRITAALEIFRSLGYDDERSGSFFQLTTHGPAAVQQQMQDVELACCKIIVRGLVMLIVFFESSYFVSIAEGQEEQPLHDAVFPELLATGACYIVRHYQDPVLKQLLLWQPNPELTHKTLSRPRVQRRNKTKRKVHLGAGTGAGTGALGNAEKGDGEYQIEGKCEGKACR